MRLKNGSVAQRYLWGAKQDELLCENNEWMLGDHLNTIRAVVENGECVHKRLKYSAFGELLNEPDDEIAFAYTGKLFDAKTGLQWNINRWYDPKVGRWISEDPIGFEAKDANLVRYVGNEVVAEVDADGLKGKTIKKLYAIDGTCSGGCDDWVGYLSGNMVAPARTNVADFVRQRPVGVLAQRWHGPTQARNGSDAIAKMNDVVSTICSDYVSAANACDNLKIYLVGWSRGGVIAVQTARALGYIGCKNSATQSYLYPQIEWLGLFDPVNKTAHANWDNTVLPYNITSSSMAVKSNTTIYESLAIFPTITYGTSDFATFYKEDGSSTTHGDIGIGWNLPSGIASTVVLDWMKQKAVAHGL